MIDYILRERYMSSWDIPFIKKVKLRLFGRKSVETDGEWRVTFYYDNDVLWLYKQERMRK